jgi:hypothetical protein
MDVWVGNESTANAKFIVSGGIVDIKLNLLLGRQDAATEMDINGGSVVVEGSSGTTFDSGSNVKKINFGTGHGEFKQTGSGKLTFNGTDDTDHTYINFTKGREGGFR